MDGVIQHSCLPDLDNQDFTFVPKGPGRWWIRNDRSPNLCLDLPGTGLVSANTQVIEYPCAETDNQYWNGNFRFAYDPVYFRIQYTPCPPARAGLNCFDYYQLHNVYWNGSGYTESDLCLDVKGPRNGGNGAPLQVYPCHAFDDHDWTWL